MSDTLNAEILKDGVFERKPLVKQLMEGVLSVNFTKIDGTERTLICTLVGDRIPKENWPGANADKHDEAIGTVQAQARKKNPSVVPVWSLVDEAWRSFRVDSVKSIRIVSNEEIAEIIPDPNTPVNIMRRSLGLPLIKGK